MATGVQIALIICGTVIILSIIGQIGKWGKDE